MRGSEGGAVPPTDRPAVPPEEPGQGQEADRRRPWRKGPDAAAPADSWRTCNDDSLLTWIQELPANHRSDEVLLDIIASDRHFFVRQTAALHLSDPNRLRSFADDRHVGQVLARRLSRAEDIQYLAHLAQSSLYLEVRRAAKAQLELVRRTAPPTRTGRS